jgi:restriction system protein
MTVRRRRPMSDVEKTPQQPPPPRPLVVNPSDADLIDEEQRRRQAKMTMGAIEPPFVPSPRPVFVEDGSANAAATIAANAAVSTPFVPPPEDFAVLLSRAVIVPYEATAEGHLIWSITAPLRSIIERIMKDPSLVYDVDSRKWEEIIAATYDESGLFDEVTLTPRSGDDGRDVIAVKKGFGSVRLIESVKRYKRGRVVEAAEMRDLLGALHADPQASKGVVSTTSDFAPMIWKTPQIMQYVPHRLELVNREDLLKRLADFTNPHNR